jgi:23S rRNA (uracil1939-C5)-methyltransferase
VPNPPPDLREIVELSVERVGAQGDGIAHSNGATMFLPFTAPGDRVRARLRAKRGGARDGRVVERLISGPERVEPRCRHFGICGGCNLQHLSASLYQAVKLGALRTALEQTGIDPSVTGPLRTVPPVRRRVRIALVRPKDPAAAVRVGFRERFSHDLVDIAECYILDGFLFAVATALRGIAPAIMAPGTAAEAMLTRTDSGADLLIEARPCPALGALEALADFGQEYDLARIVWRSAGDEIPIVERRPVRVVLSGIAVPFPPGGFLQASPAAEKILVEEVLSGIGDRRPALDLFAGLGTFALALAQAGPVHAVEGDARAAEALADAAKVLSTITVERRDLLRDPMPPETLSRYVAVVLDPPRAGAARLAEALAASTVDTVVAGFLQPRDIRARCRQTDRGRLSARAADPDRSVRLDAAFGTCGAVPSMTISGRLPRRGPRRCP